MGKLITSDIMKGAVQQLFDHEVERNGRCSSHSQLERWIIEELKNHSGPNTVLALTNVLLDTRGIIIDMGDVEDDLAVVMIRYGDYGLYTGYITNDHQAFRLTSGEGDYCLVTTPDVDDIPATMDDPVVFDLYSVGGSLLFHKKFESSTELFSDKHITYILSCLKPKKGRA
jgi:hypothetical protein